MLGVVNVAGCIRDIFVCQHPHFNFRKVRILKPEIPNFLALSEVCFSRWRLGAPQSSAVRRGIGVTFWGVNNQNDESDIFRFTPGWPPSTPSRSVYSTRARRLSSGQPCCPFAMGLPGWDGAVENSFRRSARGCDADLAARRAGRSGRNTLPLRPSFAALAAHQCITASEWLRRALRGCIASVSRALGG